MSKALQALIFGLGLVIATSIHANQAGHYRWTDDKGTVQYSDRPPEGIKAEFIKFASGRHSTDNDATSAQGNASTGSAGTPAQIVPAASIKDPELCKQAQKNMKALDSARIRITEPDGSKRLLTEEEKEEQRQSAQKFINVHC